MSKDGDKDLNLIKLITEGSNPRGIPTAKFIEDIESFLMGTTHEASLGALNELYSKYKYMENSFVQSKAAYKAKIPDHEMTLEHVRLLKKKKDEGEEFITNYNLCDTVYARANLDVARGVVYLWIGANTMVEYTVEEAEELLVKRIAGTKAKLEELNEDLFALRGNCITVEVNMARIINQGVKNKKLKAARDNAEAAALANQAN